MSVSLTVLLVEDQHDIAANIWDFLERRGHSVDRAADGRSGLALALSGRFDVIVLDLGLPRLDGLQLCRKLREAGHGVPVLMLTARDTLDDKLRGFAEGADDYMVKPFALRELEARLLNLHRRRLRAAGECLRVGPIEYEPATRTARRGDHSWELSVAQGRLLEALLRASPGVVRHADLLQAIWGEQESDLAMLHSQVSALRALIDRPFHTPLLQTVHGIGYRIGSH